MANPIHYSQSSDEYYVWLSRLGVKYMKYFQTAEEPLEFIRRYPHVCMEVGKGHAVSEEWASDAVAEANAGVEMDHERRLTVTASSNEPNSRRKGRLVYGVDVLAAALAFPITQALGVGGAIPMVLVGGALVYASSRLTQTVSASDIPVGARGAIYGGLCVAYFVATGVLFAVKDALQ